MNDDIAEMRAASRFGGSQDCSVCKLLESMTPEHREPFEKGLDTPGVNTTGMLRWLERRGYTLPVKAPAQSLRRHRASHRG